jgi:hypothetical protein
MVVDILRRWEGLPHQFRIRVDRDSKASRCKVFEARLSSGKLRHLSWTGPEENVSLAIVAFVSDKKVLRLNVTTLGFYSMHALARRIQHRPQDSGEAALIRDMSLLLRSDPDAFLDGDEVRIETTGGSWRGSIISINGCNDETRPVIAVRTWIPNP